MICQLIYYRQESLLLYYIYEIVECLDVFLQNFYLKFFNQLFSQNRFLVIILIINFEKIRNYYRK